LSGEIPPFDLYWSVSVGDMNGDGKLDIASSFTHVVGATNQPGFASVYLQDSANQGTFLAPAIYNAGDAPGGSDPGMITIGDLNGDGKPDLVTANSVRGGSTSASGISVFLQDPANPGHFLPPTNYDTGNQPAGVAIGDLNGDGKPDLAVAADNGISIFLQDPTKPGSLLPPTTLPVANGTSSVAIADLNGDGRPDLVATDGTSVLVFLQDPNAPASFLPAVRYGAGLQPRFVAVSDLNGDGKLDLAVANEGSPGDNTTASVSVLLQDPAAPGKFLPAVDYKTGLGSVYVMIADLNGDGKADLAVVNFGGSVGSVSVLLQNPTLPGQFQSATNYDSSDLPSSVAVGDMNGDGKPDLVIAGGSGVKIRFQDPANSGQFLAETPITK
jgi:hypothetical protein